MARLKRGAWLAPFWGKKGYSTGRDPLGMQVASIGTYAILLPGLTNLTRRVRYYSFYCWIIERYARDESHTDFDVFRKFVRRAELQFAYGMTVCFPDSPAVVGKDWAVRVLKELAENIPDAHDIDLASGADQNGGPTYWKYSLGAFGQYFLGSLLQLNLLREREGSPGVYLCTENGRKLASCFSAEMNAVDADAFIAAVKSGIATVKNLRSILPTISLDGITPESEEWKFLTKLLIGSDDGGRSEEPSYFRKLTVYDYLSFLSSDPDGDEFSFSRHNYELVLASGISRASEIQRGWFIYELNEVAHYSLGAVLWGLLEVLREKARPVPYRELEQELTNHVVSTLSEFSNGAISNQSTTQSVLDFIAASGITEEQIESDIVDSIEGEKPYPAMALGILLALKLYFRINANSDVLSAFALEHGMAREGDFADLTEFLRAHQTKNLVDTVSVLLRRSIVNRHIEESIRKMGGGIRNTLKFRNEDGRLFHVQTVRPQWTQPRLGSLNQFLVDLKMLDENGSITAHGAGLLQGAV